MAQSDPLLYEQIDLAAGDRALERANADVAVFCVISQEAMLRWLRSWGTPDELPPPERL
jgi:hypothetical protein